jgi:hypothetical protein
MNKREFDAGRSTLRALLTRTQRLPDLAERASADAFESYVGERFAVIGGAGAGEVLVVSGVMRVARCRATEQFTVAFAPATAGEPLDAADGTRLLAHATGQRVMLHLERSRDGYDARFNLLV